MLTDDKKDGGYFHWYIWKVKDIQKKCLGCVYCYVYAYTSRPIENYIFKHLCHSEIKIKFQSFLKFKSTVSKLL